MRSQQEIDQEIKRLNSAWQKVPQFTAFGDDNRAAIEAQIEVLMDDLEEADVYQLQDDEEYNQYQVENALEAVRWLNEDDEAPSDGWMEIS